MSRVTLFAAPIALLLASTGPSLAVVGAVSSYSQGEGRTETVYSVPNGVPGVPIFVIAEQNVSNSKLVMPSSKAQTAIMIPNAASVATADVYADASLTTPLVVAGTYVALSPDASVTADAESFSPSGAEFKWVGFSTQGLLLGQTGSTETGFFLTFGLSSYPQLEAIGDHDGQVYTTDQSQTVTPLLARYIGYRSTPALGEWGIVIMAMTMLVVAGLVLYRRSADVDGATG